MSSSPSTAATRRPTSRSCATTARCSRTRAGRCPRRTTSGSTGRSRFSRGCSTRRRRAPVSTARARSRSPSSCSPGSTSPRGGRAAAAVAARGWATRVDGRQRHVRRPSRRHRARVGRRGRLRRRHQLRRRRARRSRTRASPRSARSPATGVAATTSASRRSRRPRAARTAAGRGRPRAIRARALRPRHAARARRGVHAVGSPPRRLDRAGAARLRRGGGATRSRPRSSTASQTRSSRSRASRSTRLGLTDEPVEVVLGGGLLRPGDERLLRAVAAGLRAVGAGDGADDRARPGGRRGAARARRARRRRRGAGARCGASSARRDATTIRDATGGEPWLTSGSSGRRASTPAATSPAVDALDLEIADGELMVLVGPSGSGKSTALRMLAGLEDVDAGGSGSATATSHTRRPKDRDVAMVFQSYALYPYLTVAANMAFPLKMARVRRPSATAACARSPSCSGCRPASSASPGQLSGGQRQRVAMGRAIVRSAAGVPHGRAALQPRREAPRPDARRHRRPPGAARRDDRLRDARPVGGDDARSPGRGAPRRAAAAVRRRRGSSTTARRTPSSPALSARPR